MKNIFFRLSFMVYLAAAAHGVRANDVRDQKPYFKTAPLKRVAVSAEYRYAVEAADSAGLPVTVSVPVLPPWLNFNAAENTLSGKFQQAGQYPIRISITNGRRTSDQYFMITVYDASTRNLLCLGNSITNGTDKYNSYRRPLWKLLHAGRYNFDFIGSWDKHHWGGEVPNPDFDMDHDGHSGWTAAHLFHPPAWDSTRGNLASWLKEYTPDVVLVEFGTNDVFQCRTPEALAQDFSDLIILLRKQNPGVKIVIALVLPLGKKWAVQNLCNTEVYGALIPKMNAAILALAAKQTTKTSPVTTVDMFTGIDPEKDMYDDIHPNDKGEAIMADRWFNAVRKYLKKLPAEQHH